MGVVQARSAVVEAVKTSAVDVGAVKTRVALAGAVKAPTQQTKFNWDAQKCYPLITE